MTPARLGVLFMTFLSTQMSVERLLNVGFKGTGERQSRNGEELNEYFQIDFSGSIENGSQLDHPVSRTFSFECKLSIGDPKLRSVLS